MFRNCRREITVLCCITWLMLSAGCAAKYGGVVRPTPSLGSLSPEAEKLTTADIDMLLRASAKPTFPTVLAVARLAGPRGGRGYVRGGFDLSPLPEAETAKLRAISEFATNSPANLIDQVHVVGRVLVPERPTLGALRTAAASLHAPLLLVYAIDAESARGTNPSSIAYWTIVGYFVVPGDTYGAYAAYDGVLVDTRTGLVVGTVAGEGKREVRVPGVASDSVGDRVRGQALDEARNEFFENLKHTLTELASSAK